MIEWWWAYLALGAFVGFLGGLLGIGGGAAMVPMLAIVFAAKGFAQGVTVHLALGTSIATMIFTSASSVYSHHRRGAVHWVAWRRMLPGVVAGTLAGALLAGSLDPHLLAIAFTFLIYALATQMLFDVKPASGGRLQGVGVMSAAGGIIGFISSLSGTGGSGFTVPFLARRGLSIHHAIGTATAASWPLALAGTLGYGYTGWGHAALPERSAGFVYLPALIWIVIASVAMAPLGARVAHRTSGRTLKRVFVIVLYGLATHMLVSTIR